jgi:hypothetical protein
MKIFLYFLAGLTITMFGMWIYVLQQVIGEAPIYIMLGWIALVYSVSEMVKWL